ncbi:hypothetical protein CEQ90_03390 [Lewinellaceae bacterium SD302]|nr:hypothetical protein CEQ90_03390 [Lewinellaceae bacterium SD302]
MALLAILLGYGIVIFYYGQLPDELPRHYGSKGLPTAYASKAILFGLPIIATALYVAMGWAGNTFSDTRSNWSKLPEDPLKRKEALKLNRQLLAVMRTVIGWVFTYIIFGTIQVGRGTWEGLGEGFASAFLFLIFGLLAFHIWRLKRLEKQ